MTLTLAFLALAALFGVLALLEGRGRRRPWSARGVRELESRTVVVHTRDDQSIRGVLVKEYADCVALEAAVYIRQGQLARDERRTVNLDGRALIPAANIAWFQALPASASPEPSRPDPDVRVGL